MDRSFIVTEDEGASQGHRPGIAFRRRWYSRSMFAWAV
jgi:hypothetical protein